jgi:hypothetical protein
MDDSDKASELEEMWRQADLRRRKPEPKLDGHCLNCGSESEGAYCDSGCREDAERVERAKIRNGMQAEKGVPHT